MREIFLGMLGLCMGTTIASGVVAFIISLELFQGLPGLPEVPHEVRLYGGIASMLGVGAWQCGFSVISGALPLGNPGLAVYGSFPEFFVWKLGGGTG